MSNIYALDIETNSLSLFNKDTRLLSISFGRDNIYLPYTLDSNFSFTLELIREILANDKNTIIGHNLAFDITGLYRFIPDINIKANLFDTMVANYLTSFDYQGKNNLDSVALRYLGLSKIDVSPKDIPKLEQEKLLAYNHVDTALSYLLYEPLSDQLELNGTSKIFSWLMKILKVLIKVQVRGVNLDVKYIKKHREDVLSLIEETDKELLDTFGEVNFNSPLQIRRLFYDKLRLPIVKRTKRTKNGGGNNPSTDEETITLLSMRPDVDEDIKKGLQTLLDNRALKKHEGTYLTPLIEDHLGIDNRVHTNYYLGQGYGIDKKKFGTVSGRTSSSNPNLQNISNTRKIRDLILDIRRAFIPSSGKKLYKADYSQLEVRVAGYLAEDEILFGVFRDKVDVHTYTLAKIFNVDYNWVSDKLKEKVKKWVERRRLIKTFNFALIYGGSDWKLKKILYTELKIDMSIYEVRQIMNAWDKLYYGFTKWKFIVHESITQYGYVKSITGRERYFFNPEKEYPEPNKLRAYHREGLNHCIQSFAGDIALLGTYFMEEEFLGDPLLFVHDSIDGEYIPEENNEENLKWVANNCMVEKPKDILANEFGLDVTNLYLEVDTSFNLDHWS